MTLEGGKPFVENHDEIGWTVAAFDYYAEIGRDSAGRVIPPIESSQLAMVIKEPVGVVNLIAGDGTVGAQLVADERIDCVAFTGSVQTGKLIAGVCAERVARVNLELGGKDPFIVCADVADVIDIAARGGAWAAYLNAGQVCTSAERFYVMREVYDEYARPSSATAPRSCSATPWIRVPTSARWSRQRSAQRSSTSSRPPSRRAPRSRTAAITPAGPTATSSPRRSSSARPARPGCCARRRSDRWR